MLYNLSAKFISDCCTLGNSKAVDNTRCFKAHAGLCIVDGFSQYSSARLASEPSNALCMLYQLSENFISDCCPLGSHKAVNNTRCFKAHAGLCIVDGFHSTAVHDSPQSLAMLCACYTTFQQISSLIVVHKVIPKPLTILVASRLMLVSALLMVFTVQQCMTCHRA
jgi:hypothetical protein